MIFSTNKSNKVITFSYQIIKKNLILTFITKNNILNKYLVDISKFFISKSYKDINIPNLKAIHHNLSHQWQLQ